jgi:hypothetical protein
MQRSSQIRKVSQVAINERLTHLLARMIPPSPNVSKDWENTAGEPPCNARALAPMRRCPSPRIFSAIMAEYDTSKKVWPAWRNLSPKGQT